MQEQYNVDITLAGIAGVPTLAKAVGLTPSALYLYRDKRLPLALAGALALHSERIWAALSRTPTLFRRTRAWTYTTAVAALDREWRAKLTGAEFPLKGGGLLRIAAPATPEDSTPTKATTLAPSWDLQEVDLDAKDAAIRVLEALVVRVMRERDAAQEGVAQIAVLQAQLETLQAENGQLAVRLKEAEAMFEEACQHMNRTERPVARVDVERATPLLPGLADAIASLPKR